MKALECLFALPSARNMRCFAILLTALIAASLGGCDASSRNVQPGDSDYPGTNEHPLRFILLHGTIDPSLDVKLSIGWRAAAPNCRYYTSRIEGATQPYFAATPFPLAQNGGDFSVRLAVDGVVPGRCQWRFAGLAMAPPEGFGVSLVQTNSYPLKPGQSANGVIRLSCEKMIRKTPPIIPQLICQRDGPEDPKQSVLGGILWWQPQTTDIEIHIRKGVCSPTIRDDCPAAS